MAIRNQKINETRKLSGNYTRGGLPTGLSPEDLKTILGYSNDPIFLYRANQSLINDKIKGLYNSGLYSVKTISKRTPDFISGTQKILDDGYNGKLYESGWLDEISVYNGQARPIRLGSNLFFDRTDLPYSDSKTSGVYIDEIWSGYNVDFDNTKVVGGYVLSGVDDLRATGSGDSIRYPYRNFYEIFDHEGTQIGDMGNYVFRSGGYNPDQEIGYNAIFFKSGLNKDNILDKNPQFLFLPNPVWAKSKNKSEIIDSGFYDLNVPRNFPSPAKERQNMIRWNVFIYTGLLNYIVRPNLNNVNNFLQQDSSQVYLTKKIQTIDKIIPIVPTIDRLDCTGIYPEIHTKRFSIFNRFPYPISVYCSTSSPGVTLEYPQSFMENKNFIWTTESGYHENFKIDKIAILSSRASANLNVKVDSSFLGKGNTGEKIYVHFITGAKNPISLNTLPLSGNPALELKSNGLVKTMQRQEYVSGLASSTKTIIVGVNSIENNSKISFDDFFFETRSGQNYYPIQEVGKPFELNYSGIKNKLNKSFGLTFYSTGVNMWTDSSTRIDLLNKINKVGQYDPITGTFKDIKTIYPLLSGEAYISLLSCPTWVDPKHKNSTFKWISGFGGLFTSPKPFNPYTGALQADMLFDFKLDEILPKNQNLSGHNVLVETRNGQAPIIRNHIQDIDLADLQMENIPVCLDRSKEYRFLQINNTDTQKLEFLASEKLLYKVYEPEYNATGAKNYRLVELKLTDETPNEITWTTNSNLSGKFKVVGKLNDNEIKVSSGVYDIYNFSSRIEFSNIDAYLKQDKFFAFVTSDGTGFKVTYNPKIKLSLDKSQQFNYLSISGATGISDFKFWKKKTTAPFLGSVTEFNFPNSVTGANVYAGSLSGIPLYNKTVSFDLPSDFSTQDEIYLGFKDQESLLPITFHNENINPSQVLLSGIPFGQYTLGQIPAPVFSGNLTFATSEKVIDVPIILSGIANQTFFGERRY
jgi:hypothetical protein